LKIELYGYFRCILVKVFVLMKFITETINNFQNLYTYNYASLFIVCCVIYAVIAEKIPAVICIIGSIIINKKYNELKTFEDGAKETGSIIKNLKSELVEIQKERDSLLKHTVNVETKNDKLIWEIKLINNELADETEHVNVLREENRYLKELIREKNML